MMKTQHFDENSSLQLNFTVLMKIDNYELMMTIIMHQLMKIHSFNQISNLDENSKFDENPSVDENSNL